MEIPEDYHKIDNLISKNFHFSLADIPIPPIELYPIKIRDGLLIGSKEATEHQYLIQRDIKEFLKNAPNGYFLVGFWGHGFNSHAFYYLRVDSESKIFFRLPYGGVYMENEKEAENISKFLPEFFKFEENLKSTGLRRLYAVESMGSGRYEIEINDQVIKFNKSLYYSKEYQIFNILDSSNL